MKNKLLLLPASVALALAGTQVQANTEYLCAKSLSLTTPDGGAVPMWGYARGTAANPTCTGVNATVPGPRINVPFGDTSLTINLSNQLPAGSEGVSVVIPGQQANFAPVTTTDLQGRTRVTSFAPAAAVGASQSYTWNNLQPGTYAYHSGTHPQVQVQMGLYGMMTHDTAAKQAYGINYLNEVTLLYAEVDPELHAAVVGGTYGTTGPTSTLDYKPRYFTVNGKFFNADAATVGTGLAANYLAGDPGKSTLVRMLNLGLKSHAPALLNGTATLIAEDGRKYLNNKEQANIELPAGKTLDFMLGIPATGKTVIPVADRSLSVATASVAQTTQVCEIIDPLGDPNDPNNQICYDNVTQTVTPDTGHLTRLQFGADNRAVARNDLFNVNENNTIAATNASAFRGHVRGAGTGADTLGDYVGRGTVEYVLDSTPPADARATTNDPATTGWSWNPADGSFVYWHNGCETNVATVPPQGCLGVPFPNFSYHIKVTANGNGPEPVGSVLTETVPATATLRIVAVNDAPVAVANTYTLDPMIKSTFTIAAPGILANDYDVENNPLTVGGTVPRTVPVTNRGSFTINANGSFSFAPATNFTTSGTAAFNYVANDGVTNSANATVTVSLTNTAPTRIAGSPGTSGNPYVVSRSSATPSVLINLADLFTDAQNNIDPNSAAAFTCSKAAAVPGTLTKISNSTYEYAVLPATATGNKTLSCFATDIWGAPASTATATRNVIVNVTP